MRYIDSYLIMSNSILIGMDCSGDQKIFHRFEAQSLQDADMRKGGTAISHLVKDPATARAKLDPIPDFVYPVGASVAQRNRLDTEYAKKVEQRNLDVKEINAHAQIIIWSYLNNLAHAQKDEFTAAYAFGTDTDNLTYASYASCHDLPLAAHQSERCRYN